eukprot:GHVU01196114.1.p1 GENE.GHVU01196114.1~~GHVU01196114.1.p1  ORF type:complete len:228 (-),score=5.68 GHVU01196114.1:920-1603(-)
MSYLVVPVLLLALISTLPPSGYYAEGLKADDQPLNGDALTQPETISEPSSPKCSKTVIVNYELKDASRKEAIVPAGEENIGVFSFALEDPRVLESKSSTTANTVREVLRTNISKVSGINWNWNKFTIAFEIINRDLSTPRIEWKTDGEDNVELDQDIQAIIFKNTGPKFAACRNIECLINTYLISLPAFVVAPRFMSVGETGSLQDRSSLCMPMCRPRLSSTIIHGR